MLKEMLSSAQSLRNQTAIRFSKSPRLQLTVLLWLQILASAVIIVAALRLKPTDEQCDSRNFSWSPAAREIQYSWKTFSNIGLFTESPFFGLNQTDAIELAWSKILPGKSLRRIEHMSVH
jgi:hypothetical protein